MENWRLVVLGHVVRDLGILKGFIIVADSCSSMFGSSKTCALNGMNN